MNELSTNNEKKYKKDLITLYGYSILSNPLSISIASIFAGLNLALTLVAVLLSQGFINIGDLGVMITGLLFGPWIGAVAGGIGPMFADIILYPPTTPITLVIKALEGFLVGIIANPRKHYKKGLNYRDIMAVIIGGLTMVSGYFLAELYIFRDPGWAFSELPLNFFVQFLIGVIGSLLFTYSFRKNIIESYPQVFDNIFIEEDEQEKT